MPTLSKPRKIGAQKVRQPGTFPAAVQALLEGRRIRRAFWPSGVYVAMLPDPAQNHQLAMMVNFGTPEMLGDAMSGVKAFLVLDSDLHAADWCIDEVVD